LLLTLLSARWAGAEPRWEVRELSLQSPARIHLVGAWFVMGSDEAEIKRAIALCKDAGASGCSAEQFAAETPARRVYVKSFEIDRTEVSNASYQRCVRAGRCLPARPGSARPQQPVVRVTWREARDYCRFVGGDLPSEAQWEYAAHGDSQRSFPWGDTLEATSTALDDVSSHPERKSFFGLLHSAGNVWELVLDRYVAPYSSTRHSVEPVQLEEGSERVVRGGSFLSPPHDLRARARAAIGENEARPDVGFRCAYAAGRSGS
jgi:formylglycine-generating enzyme required for sulfatase activity